MSILPIETKFFGVNRPLKTSFKTIRNVNVQPQPRTQVGNPVGPVTNTVGQVFIQNAGTNTIEISAPIIDGLAAGMVMRVTGDSAAGAATIAGKVGPDPVNYRVGAVALVAGGQRFTLLNINTGALIAVTAGAGNSTTFAGLIFTAFQAFVGPVTLALNQVIIRDNVNDVIEIAIASRLNGLQEGNVMQVTGPENGATIAGYQGPGPSYYLVGDLVDGGAGTVQQFNLRNIADPNEVIAVDQGAGGTNTFTGLTFTALQAGGAVGPVTLVGGQVFIQDDDTDRIEIRVPFGSLLLDQGDVIQVTGPQNGATIENYVPQGPSYYLVGDLFGFGGAGGQTWRFTLRNIANFEEVIAVDQGAGTDTFTGLTFTAFRTQVGNPVDTVFYGLGQVSV
jgi:hypothetical protein